MYVNMYTCIHIYMSICAHVYMYTCIFVYMYTHKYVCACVRACVYICILYICVCDALMHTYHAYLYGMVFKILLQKKKPAQSQTRRRHSHAHILVLTPLQTYRIPLLLRSSFRLRAKLNKQSQHNQTRSGNNNKRCSPTMRAAQHCC